MILLTEKLPQIYLQVLGLNDMNEDPVYQKELATLLTRLKSNKQL